MSKHFMQYSHIANSVTVNPEYITVLKANDLQEIHGITFFIITFFIFQVVPRYPVTTTISIIFYSKLSLIMYQLFCFNLLYLGHFDDASFLFFCVLTSATALAMLANLHSCTLWLLY